MFAAHHDAEDFVRYQDVSRNAHAFTSGPLELSITANAYGYPAPMGFEQPLYEETPGYMINSSANRASPGMYPDDGDMRLPSSVPSAASSSLGSPQSHHGQLGGVPEWAPAQPGIVSSDYIDYAAYGIDIEFIGNPAKSFVGELDATSTTASATTPRPLDAFSSSSSPTTPLASSVYAPLSFPSSGPATELYPSSFSSCSSSSTFTATCLPKRQPSLSAPKAFSWPLAGPACHSQAPSAPRRTASLLSQDGGGSQFGALNSSSPMFPCSLSQIATARLTDIARSQLDPSLIHSEINRSPMGVPPYDYDARFQQQQQQQHHYPTSPSISSSPQSNLLRTDSSSPFLHTGSFQFPNSPYGAAMDIQPRRPSVNTMVPATPADYHSGDESKVKQRCTYPDCGKVYKDLKAHMLTHQTERPEKCPIQTCEYHVKGFARKYDKNRHTLTHYKGTMVCGFCPGSGSAAEKSFNRADVFKRHLTTVHGVEQNPPNSRKRASTAIGGKKLSSYAPDATGKCSTCSQTFANAQDFYEHLDDCVLRIVQQEDPTEAINAKRLAEVENDRDVHETLEKNNLPTTAEPASIEDEDENMDMVEEDDRDDTSKSSRSSGDKRKGNPSNGVQKSRGMTHSRGGPVVTTKTRRRKNRRDYPSSWGFDKGQMTMKKRVLTVFNGPRRLAKDDMMLSTDHEVRIKLSDGNSYVTDLDVQTLKRAEGFHSATDAERGPWISDDPNEEQLKEMQQMLETSSTVV